MTTVFNGAGEGSAKASWVLMRRTRADTFRSANRRKNLHRFSMLHVAEPKNRTCIGPHPRTPKKPTISVVERGYVRRSEFGSDEHACLVRFRIPCNGAPVRNSWSSGRG